MQAPKVYVALILMLVFTAVAPAGTQTARTGREVTDSQDPKPQSSNSEERTATGRPLNSANSSGQPASAQTPQMSGGGQRQSGQATGVSNGTPAEARAGVLNSPPLTTSPGSGAVPQSALFEFLFNNISALNKVADSDDKAGNHTSAALWMTHDQRAAGLNDAEGQILQEIALDCLQMLKEQDSKFQVAAQKFRAQLKPGASVQIPRDLAHMFEDRKKIVSDHIEKLREALGDASFNKLDAYVRSSFAPQANSRAAAIQSSLPARRQPNARSAYPPTGMVTNPLTNGVAVTSSGHSSVPGLLVPGSDGRSVSTVPAHFLYDTLFENMAMMDQLADREDREGKHEMASRWRTHGQRAAGLSEAEGEILKEIGLDCSRAVQDQNAKINALLQKLDAQRVPGVITPASPELAQLVQDRDVIIQDHIEKLREALGESSFAKFDRYVKAVFHAGGVSNSASRSAPQQNSPASQTASPR